MTATQAPTTETAPGLSYQFGTGTATGVWLGLGAGRVAVVGVGLLASIISLTAGVAVPIAAVPFLGCLTLATVRVAGRPLLEWAARVLGYRRSVATGAIGWHPPFPTTSLFPLAPVQRLRLPREYGRLRLRECADDSSIGILVDLAARTATAVFEVAGVDRFPLLDPTDRDGLIAGWGQSLAVLADTDGDLVRLQLVDRAANPGAAADPADPADVGRDDAALRRMVNAFATRHDSRLAVQWAFGRVDELGLATVAARCRGVSRSLLAARLLTRPLSTGELTLELATVFRGPRPVTSPIGTPGPVSRRSSWSHVAVDDVCHRSYAVTGWPAAAVTADWLAPLLLAAPTGVTRTVAIHLERVTPAAAARTARAARAKAVLDQRDRVRLGMTTSAAIDRAASCGVAMDEELAAGYRTHRLAGVVTLTAPSTDGLDAAAPSLRQAAAAARLELQPLHGQHDQALAATAPLCRVRSRGPS